MMSYFSVKLLKSLAFMAVGLFAFPVIAHEQVPSSQPDGDPTILEDFLTNAYSASFRHMHQVLPMRVVPSAHPNNIYPLYSDEKSRFPKISYDYRGKRRNLEKIAKKYHINAIIVVKDQNILLEKYYHDTDRHTHWPSFSISKSVTSTLLGIAIKQGYVKSVNDKVTRYLPQLNGTPYKNVTIRNLLEMSSGMQWNEFTDEISPDARRLVQLILMGKKGSVLKTLSELKQECEPGKKFSYNTLETSIIGEIISVTTGKNLSEYLSDNIWNKFGMEEKAFWLLESKDGHEVAGGGIMMTLRDYARFGLFMANGGNIEGKSILPENWIAQSTVPGADSPQISYGKVLKGSPIGYGYQWWSLPQKSEQYPYFNGAYAGNGMYGQFLYIDPKEKLVIVIWSAWKKPLVFEAGDEVYTFLGQIAKVTSGK